MKQVLIILFFLLTSGVMAQTDSLRLSVQDCIDLALENNIELKNSQLDSLFSHRHSASLGF